MSSDKTEHLTRLLNEWNNGNKEALNELLPLVYEELRRLAHNYMKRERANHTLRTAALIHEAYLRLIDQQSPWQNRTQFIAVAATLMRRVLIDHARNRSAKMRGGGVEPVSIDEALIVSDTRSRGLVALDDALNRLAVIDARKARVVELRCFGGLSSEEIADVLDISAVTVARDWNMAKAWLRCEVGDDA